jgi:hypothetical protein
MNTYPQELSTSSFGLWDSLKSTLKIDRYLTRSLRFTLAGEPLGAARKRRLIAVGALYVIGISSVNPVNAYSKTHPEIAILKIYTHQRLGDLKQLNCVDKLWMKESKWNYKADNKHSTAFGIPQILDLKEKDPYRQIDLGLKYIRYRYQTPCKAWEFWKAASPHHY